MRRAARACLTARTLAGAARRGSATRRPTAMWRSAACQRRSARQLNATLRASAVHLRCVPHRHNRWPGPGVREGESWDVAVSARDVLFRIRARPIPSTSEPCFASRLPWRRSELQCRKLRQELCDVAVQERDRERCGALLQGQTQGDLLVRAKQRRGVLREVRADTDEASHSKRPAALKYLKPHAELWVCHGV